MKPITRMMLLSSDRKGGRDGREGGRRDYDREHRNYDRDGRDWNARNYDDSYRVDAHYTSVPPMYRERSDYRPMNRIGFSVDGTMDREVPREFSDDYRRDEMSYRQSARTSGHGSSDYVAPLDEHTAKEWMSHMKNTDGTTGPHWTLEQVRQVMSQRGLDCDPVEFWAAMNMVYSDYYSVAKRHDMGGKIDFYVDMAKAFLDDKDARPDKLARYYDSIVDR